MHKKVLYCSLLLITGNAALSQTKEYTLKRGEGGEIRVDGIPDEDLCKNAEAISLDYETDPGNNIPAEVTTILLIAFDDENLYFSFDAKDPKPDNIRAIINDRDKLDDNDFVHLRLDKG